MKKKQQNPAKQILRALLKGVIVGKVAKTFEKNGHTVVLLEGEGKWQTISFLPGQSIAEIQVSPAVPY